MTIEQINEMNRILVLKKVSQHPGLKSHELARECGWNANYTRNLLNWLSRRREAFFKWSGDCKVWYPTGRN